MKTTHHCWYRNSRFVDVMYAPFICCIAIQTLFPDLQIGVGSRYKLTLSDKKEDGLVEIKLYRSIDTVHVDSDKIEMHDTYISLAKKLHPFVNKHSSSVIYVNLELDEPA